MAWFEKAFGRTVEEARRPPILILREGDEVICEFLEDEPRLIDTTVGQRPAIIVKVDDVEQTLLISHMVLGIELVKLQEEGKGSLKGIRVRIRNEGRRGRAYAYTVERVK